jgi:hypothetical protein
LRAYTVATVAVSLNMAAKWVDNVLSHHDIPGVSKRRQGVSRRLTPQAVLCLEVAMRLGHSLSIPLADGLELAQSIAGGGDRASVDAGKGITITIDLRAIRDELTERLANAVEVTPLPRRGRPPRRS